MPQAEKLHVNCPRPSLGLFLSAFAAAARSDVVTFASSSYASLSGLAKYPTLAAAPVAPAG